MTSEVEFMEIMGSFYDDPLGYVMFAFPWDEDPLIQLVDLKEPYKSRYNCEFGPDLWACEFLDELGREVKARGFDGKTAVDPIRFSTASGHGIGKSVMVCWLIKWILDTRPFSMGVVTANTGDQLKTKTWAEMSKWHGLSISKQFWSYTSGRGAMSYYRKGEYGRKWRCDAMTCREENSESFQGLHAANSTPFYIFDEASGIPDKIFEARAGGATDGEPMSFDFGNPTRKSGYFFENTVGKLKHRYITRSIDSRSVQIAGGRTKALFHEWAEDHGEDSDFFKVKVKGEFPSAGSLQFIASDLVDEAMDRSPVIDDKEPLCIGVDVARFGADSTVIYPRIGMDASSWPIRSYKGLDTVQVVKRVIQVIREFNDLGKSVSLLAVDGGGLGAGVVDQLRSLGYDPLDVNFGKKANEKSYRYWGDEMWGGIREALQKLSIPKDLELKDQLTQREYAYTLSGQINLESKRDMKKRLGEESSPDKADALALTFAAEPARASMMMGQGKPVFAQSEYDPYA